MKELILALGLVAVIEGLVLALVPLRLEDLLKALRDIPVQTRRNIGLGIVFVGVVIVWASRLLYGISTFRSLLTGAFCLIGAHSSSSSRS